MKMTMISRYDVIAKEWLQEFHLNWLENHMIMNHQCDHIHEYMIKQSINQTINQSNDDDDWWGKLFIFACYFTRIMIMLITMIILIDYSLHTLHNFDLVVVVVVVIVNIPWR